jgi:hypothetical protein
MDEPVMGSVGWMDLTVENADEVRDFYAEVVGWGSQGLDMEGGAYQDYVMTNAGGDAVGGVCHARGANAAMPAAWMIYVHVADLDASLSACRETGGEVVVEPREAGGQGRYAVIRDPAGAAMALFQAAEGGE